MKFQPIIRWTFILFFVIQACEESNNQTSLSPTDFLTNPQGWVLSEVDFNSDELADSLASLLGITSEGERQLLRDQVREELAAEFSLQDCEADDVVFFQRSGKIEVQEVGTTCPDGNQDFLQDATWQLFEEETKLLVTSNKGENFSFEVLDLQERLLVLQIVEAIDPNAIGVDLGIDLLLSYTFIPQ